MVILASVGKILNVRMQLSNIVVLTQKLFLWLRILFATNMSYETHSLRFFADVSAFAYIKWFLTVLARSVVLNILNH